MKQLFKQYPYIQSGNVTLKKLDASDIEGIKELILNQNVYRFLPAFIWEKNCNNMLNFINNDCMILFNNSISIILGIYIMDEFCGIAEIYGYDKDTSQVKIGYRLIERFWGQGIATCTVKLMTDYLFMHTNVEVISASHMIDNPASGKVLEKCGFSLKKTNVEEDWGFECKTLVSRWKLNKTDWQK